MNIHEPPLQSCRVVGLEVLLPFATEQNLPWDAAGSWPGGPTISSTDVIQNHPNETRDVPT